MQIETNSTAANSTSSEPGPRPIVVGGFWVRIRGLHRGQDDFIHLVDDAELLANGHVVSPSSLLGRLLIGRRVGDSVVFDGPGGRIRLQILDAGRSDRFNNRLCALDL